MGHGSSGVRDVWRRTVPVGHGQRVRNHSGTRVRGLRHQPDRAARDPVRAAPLPPVCCPSVDGKGHGHRIRDRATARQRDVHIDAYYWVRQVRRVDERRLKALRHSRHPRQHMHNPQAAAVRGGRLRQMNVQTGAPLQFQLRPVHTPADVHLRRNRPAPEAPSANQHRTHQDECGPHLRAVPRSCPMPILEHVALLKMLVHACVHAPPWPAQRQHQPVSSGANAFFEHVYCCGLSRGRSAPGRKRRLRSLSSDHTCHLLRCRNPRPHMTQDRT